MSRPETLEARTLGLICRSVTHELRQPLSLIAGYAELLATREMDEAERAALVDQIRRAAARLAASLDRLEHPDRPRSASPYPLAEWGLLDLRG